ncbi:helix-turn-helix transcriptional regulator [Bhargavaea beijingensis]|uniref:helix-turn-helix transcriptional regulator n=1 Tax=Bhargavaea beijingensis TaxID=426756 RepID=UPI002224B473|nr:helix-turn-helix transcriptional regulator [Bhargavaea beijingensis]MCW1926953.1 helix-turn-helix domain-containing protein [Bhargavaea beijingensis]
MKKNKETIYKLHRLYADKTVAEVASMLGLAESTVYAVENGLREPSAVTRAAYARHFPVNEKFIFFVESYHSQTYSI